MDQPRTGTGDNPLQALRVEPDVTEPKSVYDFAERVEERAKMLNYWVHGDIIGGTAPIVRELIARIESDLLVIKDRMIIADEDTEFYTTVEDVDDYITRLEDAAPMKRKRSWWQWRR